MISSALISHVVAESYKRAITTLPSDVQNAITNALTQETNPIAKWGLDIVIKNVEIAQERLTPICQDTGVPEFFVKIGTKVTLDGDIDQAIKEGIVEVTQSVPLIPLAVHPLTRVNTMTNTGHRVPIIHYSLIPEADYLEFTTIPACAAPQTFSAVKMFPSGTPMADVKQFILETVANITGAVCPPLIIGVGVGGLFGTVGRLAREASMRPLDVRAPDPEIANLERALLHAINKLGIGHMNLGGDITALAVNVEYGHTHAPCFPVAVQIQCWCCRRMTVRIDSDGNVGPWR
jgi:tartrate/fumarate subfamily iron-sulfur-dependent hydro-lyase alpha chain